MQSSPPRPERTLVASVLFVDIVEFSRASVTEQIEIKRALTKILRKTLWSIDDDDYRLMDTGDGAAIGFLSDPEHALYFALAIDAAVREAPSTSRLGADALRIGINVGPVKDVFDVNDRPTLIGDGINTAQRIVSFAEPGQITISRSFFELVSRLAPEYSGIFIHVGTHDDKHGREHDVYVIKPPKEILGKIQERLQIHVAEATGLNVVFTDKPGAPRGAPPAALAQTPPRVATEEGEPAAASAPRGMSTSATTEVDGTANAASVSPNAATPLRMPAQALQPPRPRRSWLIIALAVIVVVAAIIVTPLLMRKERNGQGPAALPAHNPAAATSAPIPAAQTPSGNAQGGNTPATSERLPVSGRPVEDSTNASSAVSPKSAPDRASTQTPTTGGADAQGSGASRASTATKNGSAPPARAKTAGDAQPSSKASASGTLGSYSRCSSLMQKASLGIALSPAERQEMAQFCR